MTPPALLSAALLLLLLPPTLSNNLLPLDVVVVNSLLGSAPEFHTTYVAKGGNLLGALRRLQESSKNFKFTYTDNLDYGPYLESVNGLAGNNEDRTYWELKVKTAGEVIERLDVGIGCYIPKEKEQIILNFTRY